MDGEKGGEVREMSGTGGYRWQCGVYVVQAATGGNVVFMWYRRLQVAM